jgi:hypothetical protein
MGMEKIEQIMSLISEADLSKLAEYYTVNRYNNKLTGELIFKSLLRLILLGKRLSLRMLQTLINQGVAITRSPEQVTYSGISKRLKVIQCQFFKALYEHLLKQLSSELAQGDHSKLHRFDSTIITLSGYLIKDGLKLGGKAKDSQIKVSIGLKNQLPTSIRFCHLQQEASEDIALVKAINEAKIDHEDILLFDRGISKGATFESFTNRCYKFVTRLKVGRRYKVVEKLSISDHGENRCRIIEDLIVNLYSKETGKPMATKLRLVKLVNKEGNEIWLLSNLFETPAFEIADFYSRRWDIEVFFKFIKQNLGYKHFISHSMNGMKVYIYMVLITALLFLVYKIRCKLKGFKIPLLEFTIALEKSFIKTLIVLSGGDFETVKQYF